MANGLQIRSPWLVPRGVAGVSYFQQSPRDRDVSDYLVKRDWMFRGTGANANASLVLFRPMPHRTFKDVDRSVMKIVDALRRLEKAVNGSSRSYLLALPMTSFGDVDAVFEALARVMNRLYASS